MKSQKQRPKNIKVFFKGQRALTTSCGLVFKVLNVQKRVRGTLRQHCALDKMCSVQMIPESVPFVTERSNLWKCGPSERILQWGRRAGGDPADTCADRHTGWEGPAGPGLQREDLKCRTQTHTSILKLLPAQMHL